MRIGIDVSPAVHERAGLGRYAHELTAALIALDHTNQYVAFYNNPAAAKIVPPLDALPHITSPLPNKPWRMSVLLSHIARRSQDDLLPGVALFHATEHLLPRFAHIKSVFTLHDLAFQTQPAAHTVLNRWFLSTAMPLFLRRADAIIAISEWTKQDAVRLYNIPEEKISVIYEGVHPSFMPCSPQQVAAIRQKYGLPQHVILYVGTIEPRKNLTTLLDAYTLLRRAGAVAGDTKLVLVGKKGWLYQPFFQHLHEIGMESEVIFPGYVDGADLPALYSAAGVFVFPSLFEGFGLPVLEAMACGTPVVCSTSSSLPEVAGGAAILVDPANTAGLAAALQRVLDNPDLRAKLVASGAQQAGRFTWEKAAQQTLAVYQHVMDKKN